MDEAMRDYLIGFDPAEDAPLIVLDEAAFRSMVDYWTDRWMDAIADRMDSGEDAHGA